MGMTLLHYVETCKLADNYISLPVKEDFKWMLEVPEEGEERKVYLAPDETSYMVGERYATEDVGYLILARVGKVKDGEIIEERTGELIVEECPSIVCPIALELDLAIADCTTQKIHLGFTSMTYKRDRDGTWDIPLSEVRERG